ncbi:TonB-dependent receptor plug domain-containing protein [Marinomonas posidonica]|uniref:TonB-dependent receptor plug n=1 Tax=Marinomonas posidonica (strain CECT 7376 / NCIMB 14433 / IVIA-Po-181) TaxID=491952 RepID=F6CU56_MARPP|nr:TonB-dependent receptor [Marinomonas posidonica]AEF54108.1 TonB-dependent receptor plug [Marinomonas posidonica IVIA-Po-181]
MRSHFLLLLCFCSAPAWAEEDRFFLDMDALGSSDLSDTQLGGYDGFLEDIPVVVTPSKIPQPRVDVSSSLSVLDGEFIRRVNVQYVEDLLQFVPGFSVVPYRASSQIVASYHGTQLDQYRRIQVLINGRSVYSVGLARVEWATLPLNIEDVARVEINRGPNAASYGINSFFAVVNIITRSPLETLGNSVTAYAGSQGDMRLYGQHSGLGKKDWSYRASASTTKVAGFDLDADGDERHDGHGATMGNVFLQQESSDSRFDLDIGASHLKANIDPSNYESNSSTGSYDTNDPLRIVDREYIKVGFSQQTSANHELKLQYYYDQSDANEYHETLLNYQFYNLIFGGSETENVNDSYELDLIETRHDIELQSTWQASDQLRMISALGYRWEKAESEHYLSGIARDEVFRLSSNIEYRADQHWVLNTGAMLEHSELSGTFLSPKLGVTYKLSEQDSLRFNVSKAVRTPDLSDQHFRWHFVLSNGDSSTVTYADEGEEEEKITSYELGYYRYWPTNGLSLDIKLYHDEVDEMVLSSKVFSALSGTDAPIEEGVTEDVIIDGVELELDWRSRSGAITRFTYAYQDTQTDNSTLERATTPIMMSLFSSLPLSDHWSIQGYYWYGKELGGRDYQVANSWLAYRHSFGLYSKATFGTGVEVRLDDNALVSRNNVLEKDAYTYVFASLTF